MIEMANAIQAGREKALAIHKVRLRDPKTGQYLHMSAKGLTQGTTFAWGGFPHQAETLRQRAAAKGTPWPYHAIPVREDTITLQHPVAIEDEHFIQ